MKMHLMFSYWPERKFVLGAENDFIPLQGALLLQQQCNPIEVLQYLGLNIAR